VGGRKRKKGKVILLQPVMALVFATIAGLHDAREGKPPYFWSLFTNPDHRSEMLRDGWKGVGKVFLLAMLLDVIYQVIVQRFVFPGEVVLVAILLAIIPYLVARGVVTRVATLFR
jgi:hypothetical protein